MTFVLVLCSCSGSSRDSSAPDEPSFFTIRTAAPVAGAESVGAPMDPHTRDVRAMPDNVAMTGDLVRAQDLLVANLPAEERLWLATFPVHCVDFATGMNVAVTYPTGTAPGVYIADSFLGGLATYAAAMVMGATFKRPNLEDRYLDYFWESVFFDKGPLVSIEDYAGLSSGERSRWQSPAVQQTVAVATEQAVLFVLAHELGHKVLYEQTGVVSGPRAEAKVDQWALHAIQAAGQIPTFGAAIALSMIARFERYAVVPQQLRSHPRSANRVVDAVRKAEAGNLALYAKPPYSAKKTVDQWLAHEHGLRAHLEKALKYDPGATVASLERAANAGDARAAHAHAILLQNLGGADDLVKARRILTANATQGWANSQSLLAFMDYHGRASRSDKQSYYAWAVSAAVLKERYGEHLLQLADKRDEPDSQFRECVDREYGLPLATCVARRREACVQSCINHFGHSPVACETAFCGSQKQYGDFFQRCYDAETPTVAEVVATCR